MNIQYNEIKKIAISNRKLSGTVYLDKVRAVAASGAEALILREKDMEPEEYFSLADRVVQCLNNYYGDMDRDNNLKLFLHSGINHDGSIYILQQLIEYVRKNNLAGIHFTGRDFIQYVQYDANNGDMSDILWYRREKQTGVSVHSLEEAREAEKMGADYIIAGHIFATDCKPGVSPRGLDFLQSVCDSVTIPVYAIGGITEENAWRTMNAGASGICMMSGYFSSMPCT